MPWLYESSTGNLLYSNAGIDSGSFIAKGYSGKKGYKNNIMFDHVSKTGPIPPGMYTIGLPYQSQTKGPITMNLNPFGHNAFNRTLFRIHGNNRKDDASEGCIILPPEVRKKLGDSKDRVILVVRKLKKTNTTL
jgi:lipoprotein-anchoring transpeptidase ErfK/SrfK